MAGFIATLGIAAVFLLLALLVVRISNRQTYAKPPRSPDDVREVMSKLEQSMREVRETLATRV